MENIVTPTQFNSSYYPVYYKGKFSDTIKIGERCCAYYHCFPQEPYYEINDLAFPDSNNFKLFVDTSIHVLYKDEFMSFDRKKGDFIVDSIRYYNAYIIFAYNLSDTLLYAGHGNNLSYVYMEYLNESGVWKQLNELMRGCGTDLRDFVLFPNEIMAAKYIPNSNGRLAQCRLTWDYMGQKIYSNTFYDRVPQ